MDKNGSHSSTNHVKSVDKLTADKTRSSSDCITNNGEVPQCISNNDDNKPKCQSSDVCGEGSPPKSISRLQDDYGSNNNTLKDCQKDIECGVVSQLTNLEYVQADKLMGKS